MEIIVCIKQVPGGHVEVDPETGLLRRDGAAGKMNPYDLFALEAALALREAHGGRVRVVTMGPPAARGVVQEAVYMGADSGVVASDARFAGADVLATGYTLAQAIKTLGAFDLILCGKQTTDGDTAQVGAELAEFLQLPHAAGVYAIEPKDRYHLFAHTRNEDCLMELEIDLPCLLCVDGDINTPRLPSWRRRLAAGEQTTLLSLDDLADRDPARYGTAGSPTRVERIFPPEAEGEAQLLAGSGEKMAGAMFALLREKKFIGERI